MMQNIIKLEILKDTFEKWNWKLISTVSIEMFASMDRLYPKDILEEKAEQE